MRFSFAIPNTHFPFMGIQAYKNFRLMEPLEPIVNDSVSSLINAESKKVEHPSQRFTTREFLSSGHHFVGMEIPRI
jgi:hypothetical protein